MAITLLEKRVNDFFFTGKATATATAKAGDVIAAGMFFGLLGGLIAADATALVEMRVDHLNGGFVRLQEAKPTKPAVMRMK